MANREKNNFKSVREMADYSEMAKRIADIGSFSKVANFGLSDIVGKFPTTNYFGLFSSEDAEIQDIISNLRKELRDKSDELTAEKRKGADVSAQMTELQDWI